MEKIDYARVTRVGRAESTRTSNEARGMTTPLPPTLRHAVNCCFSAIVKHTNIHFSCSEFRSREATTAADVTSHSERRQFNASRQN
jgi:hypothetical protein